MAQPPEFAWSDIEKALQQLAGMVNESAGSASDPSLRATLETMVNELNQGAQQFGVLLTKANAELAAERDSAGKFAHDVLAANEQLLQRAQDVVAKREAFQMPTAAEPEADPGPRLCRELLDRYGFDLSKSDQASVGWDTWFDASSSAISPPAGIKKAETVDEAEKEWQKLFESSLEQSKPPVSPPAKKTPQERTSWRIRMVHLARQSSR